MPSFHGYMVFRGSHVCWRWLWSFSRWLCFGPRHAMRRFRIPAEQSRPRRRLTESIVATARVSDTLHVVWWWWWIWFSVTPFSPFSGYRAYRGPYSLLHLPNEHRGLCSKCVCSYDPPSSSLPFVICNAFRYRHGLWFALLPCRTAKFHTGEPHLLYTHGGLGILHIYMYISEETESFLIRLQERMSAMPNMRGVAVAVGFRECVAGKKAWSSENPFGLCI